MDHEEFSQDVRSFLDDNGAVDSVSVDGNTATVWTGARAGYKAKNAIILDAVEHDYDATYNGCSNGWEQYTIRADEPAQQPSDGSGELHDIVETYRRDAGGRRRMPSFGDWLAEYAGDDTPAMQDVQRELGTQEAILDGLQDEYEQIREQMRSVRENRYDTVVNGLHRLQDDLDDDEEVPLLDASESGRNGSYEFTEVMTADGIAPTDIGRVNSAGNAMDDAHTALYTWDEAPVSPEEYLDHRQRNTAEHIDKLAERLQTFVSDDLPTVHYQGRPV